MPPQTTNRIEPTDGNVPRARPEPLVLNQEPRPREASGQRQGGLAASTLASIRELHRKEGLEFGESDIPALENTRITPPTTPPFPILIFQMALMKDIIDIFVILPDLAGLTIIGLFVTVSVRIVITAFTLITILVLVFWTLNKLNAMQKLGYRLVRKWLQGRVALGTAGAICELIVPYIPFTIIYVLLAHYREKKYVKLVLGALEMLGKSAQKERGGAPSTGASSSGGIFGPL